MRAKRNGSNTPGSVYRVSSLCAVTAAAATSVPLGMRVPSESVTSFTALRNRFTAARACRVPSQVGFAVWGRKKDGGRGLTEGPVGEPQRLLEEAVELAHLADRRLAPPLSGDDALDLLPEGRDVLRVRREVVQRVRERLQVAPPKTKIALSGMGRGEQRKKA